MMLFDYEIKRCEVVWELFYSEVVYLMSYLLVFKEVRIGLLMRIFDKMLMMFRIYFLY